MIKKRTFVLCLGLFLVTILVLVACLYSVKKTEEEIVSCLTYYDLLENQDFVKSVYCDYGYFEFLHLRDNCTKEKMVEVIFDFHFNEEIVLEDCRIKAPDGNQNIGEKWNDLSAVISGPSNVIDEIFKGVLKEKIDEYETNGFDRYSNYWYWNIAEYNVELENYHFRFDVGREYDFKSRSASYTQKDYHYYFSKETNGKKYVFMVATNIGLTNDGDRYISFDQYVEQNMKTDEPNR